MKRYISLFFVAAIAVIGFTGPSSWGLQKTAPDTLLTERILNLASPRKADLATRAPITEKGAIDAAVTKADSAVVSINIYKRINDENGPGLEFAGAGSGIIISSDGYILTNNHVIANSGAEYVVLLKGGGDKIPQIVYRNSDTDIAIIKISGTYHSVASLGDSSKLETGETIIAIGDAFGQYRNTVSVGKITRLNKTIQASGGPQDTTEELKGIIQVDASIYPGYSGGPLLDLNGDVVGVNVATAIGQESVGYSIPINSIKKIIANFL